VTTVHAVRYIGPMRTGFCRPQLFECDDGKQYVIKFMSNPQGIRILPNELIAYRLGKLLHLPVVEGKIITIPERLINETPDLQPFQLKAGPHFGSEFYPNSMYATSRSIPKCTNLHHIPLMIAFDYWINNNDRAASSANYVIKKGDNWTLHLIDHGSCFYGAGWTSKVLQQNNQHVQVYWGEVYERFVPFIDCPDPFSKALDLLVSLDRTQIAETVIGIPDEWEVSKAELDVLVEHLIQRQPHVPDAIEQIKPYFPIWSKCAYPHTTEDEIRSERRK
jgi:hypothetical protein